VPSSVVNNTQSSRTERHLDYTDAIFKACYGAVLG
jgi:hypothetical protein